MAAGPFGLESWWLLKLSPHQPSGSPSCFSLRCSNTNCLPPFQTRAGSPPTLTSSCAGEVRSSASAAPMRSRSLVCDFFTTSQACGGQG